MPRRGNSALIVLATLTAALAAAWAIEPLWPRTVDWQIRSAMLAGCILLNVAAFAWLLASGLRAQRAVQNYIARICGLDFRDVNDQNLAVDQPRLGHGNPWRPVLASFQGLTKAWAERLRTLECERACAEVKVRQRRKSPSQRVSEIRLASHDGLERLYQVTCRSTGHFSEGGQPSTHGAVAVLDEVTDQRAARKHHVEFVSAVSHEMKTPLSAIKAYVELLADGKAEDEDTREEFLRVINAQADRLQRLIDNMLDLARIEAGVVEVSNESRSLNELLEEAAEVVLPSAERKQIRLDMQLSNLYLGVFADRDMMLQAAINLLSNAIKYTDKGGLVTLRSRMDDHDVVFEVQDTGVGLSPEDGVRVFEEFYRVKKDCQMASGTGLGLPLAKHIVEDVHGGKLTVTSELGVGSTFRVVLPNADSLSL